MLAKILQRLHEQHGLDVPRLAEATGLDTSTIYKWIAGDSEPGFRNVKLLFNAGSRDVQQALISLFTSSTDWVGVLFPADLDVNGDGDVDFDDVLDTTIAATRRMTEQLQLIRDAGADAVMGDLERDHLNEGFDQTIGNMANGKRLVNNLHLLSSKRRKAKRASKKIRFAEPSLFVRS